ncbi:uncharacterized protein AMSG_03702 [Thecamonas trahens ATCC 50062]|uniref:Uncharacterized protein n=1 Tax=Thecamonas trahens ATCC 50062 TaxID=461836 RepID=A0A0L0D4H9_THETB|nr:hypothetical protein AMSG_03702 [Thecamonas trahens ATCC 50062]KNC47272.1 hypothetical protein AMSG_03702 [Thecamonas trahens ATCC 50062]|eukprot:XP_013759615.1 hypothetical protein AMSG_03702 [Thecamonas trahens ATCC 50062]
MSADAETMVLDAWLASKTGESRKWAKTQIADGKVDVNGAIVKVRAYVVHDGDVITVTVASDDGGDEHEYAATVGKPLSAEWPWTAGDGAGGSGKSGKKGRFLGADKALNKIQWDPRLRDKTWVVGYEDRFTGVQEMPLAAWLAGLDEGLGSIPTHRIRHLSGDGVVLWDRQARLNLLDGE